MIFYYIVSLCFAYLCLAEFDLSFSVFTDDTATAISLTMMGAALSFLADNMAGVHETKSPLIPGVIGALCGVLLGAVYQGSLNNILYNLTNL